MSQLFIVVVVLVVAIVVVDMHAVHSNHSSFAVVWVAVLAGCAPPVGLSAFLVGADFGGRGHGGGCHGRVGVRGARSSWTRSC